VPRSWDSDHRPRQWGSGETPRSSGFVAKVFAGWRRRGSCSECRRRQVAPHLADLSTCQSASRDRAARSSRWMSGGRSQRRVPPAPCPRALRQTFPTPGIAILLLRFMVRAVRLSEPARLPILSPRRSERVVAGACSSGACGVIALTLMGVKPAQRHEPCPTSGACPGYHRPVGCCSPTTRCQSCRTFGLTSQAGK